LGRIDERSLELTCPVAPELLLQALSQAGEPIAAPTAAAPRNDLRLNPVLSVPI
jgi:hypothetical protein